MKADLPRILKSNEEALSLIMKAIEKANYKPGKDIFIALDSAASSFYEEGQIYSGGGKEAAKIRRGNG